MAVGLFMSAVQKASTASRIGLVTMADLRIGITRMVGEDSTSHTVF